ncbi:UTRA domain-containing protein [Phytopseudomonas dryadis]|uniref:GntR family transcriptional regulator n=1 Tax=Phytopseudomonas dryadis TaxID=2487520 RepID=A0A4Q9RAJ0_9GAMM|nr:MULTISPECIES: UTRA domain-containing protein [Pseudomonas]TBU97587.1 GntR family transcriptional regulator [Pseudomonas dryadis]TBV10042.1 GntR family transcriptional regulator [Pseudomonas dryadis]TBV19128.1 GntR family transcriptional regulator [Pseudomonas sp. FRB 230]
MTLRASQPHYLRIRDQLVIDISQGALASASKLPPERDLAERFGCTRVTLRQALQLLETDGLIYRENRRGWYLSPPRVRYDPTRTSGFMEYVVAQGRIPVTECLHAELRPAGAWLAKRMGLDHPEQAVFYLQRRRWVDRRPVLLEYNALLASWCPGLLSHDLNGSLTALLRERFARVHSRSEMSMRPGTVNDVQAELLQVSPGSSSFYLERLNFGEHDQPVEFDQELWRSDSLTVVLDTRYPG